MFHIILKLILIVSISLNIQGEKNYKQYMKLRASPYVLRIYAGKRKDPIEESYSELLLFTAWRDERTTFGNDEEDFRDMIRVMFLREGEELTDINEDILRNTPKKGYEVEKNRKKIYPHSDRIGELRELLEEYDFLRNAKMDNEQQNADDCEDDNEESDNDISEEFPKYSDLPYAKNKKNTSSKLERCDFKLPDVPQIQQGDTFVDDVELMKDTVRTLSYEQRVVFDKYIDFCKRVMCSIRYGGNVETDPPRLIVHGGGGVGKTYLINLISNWVHHLLSSWGDNSIYPKITRFAYTGVAAFLIGKNIQIKTYTTINSLININH